MTDKTQFPPSEEQDITAEEKLALELWYKLAGGDNGFTVSSQDGEPVKYFVKTVSRFIASTIKPTEPVAGMKSIAAQIAYDILAPLGCHNFENHLQRVTKLILEIIAAHEKPGYVLVPVEPTEEMLKAANGFWGNDRRVAPAYKAMINAAPWKLRRDKQRN